MLESASDASGRWLDSAVGKIPKGKVDWRAPAGLGIQTWVGVIDGDAIATIKTLPHYRGYIAHLTGWLWKVDPDSSAAKMGVKESPSVMFRRRASAQAAIQAVIDALPAPGQQAVEDGEAPPAGGERPRG